METDSKPKRHPFLIILLVILISALFVLGYLLYGLWFSKPTYAPWEPREITSENLPTQLESFSVVQEIPSDGTVELIIDEERYTIERGVVRRGGTESADIIIRLPSRYLTIIGNEGWCSGLQQAKLNGELGIQLQGSSTSLGLKYRSLLKYKDCLG